jgi:hypothetical protein
MEIGIQRALRGRQPVSNRTKIDAGRRSFSHLTHPNNPPIVTSEIDQFESATRDRNLHRTNGTHVFSSHDVTDEIRADFELKSKQYPLLAVSQENANRWDFLKKHKSKNDLDHGSPRETHNTFRPG